MRSQQTQTVRGSWPYAIINMAVLALGMCCYIAVYTQYSRFSYSMSMPAWITGISLLLLGLWPIWRVFHMSARLSHHPTLRGCMAFLYTLLLPLMFIAAIFSFTCYTRNPAQLGQYRDKDAEYLEAMPDEIPEGASNVEYTYSDNYLNGAWTSLQYTLPEDRYTQTVNAMRQTYPNAVIEPAPGNSEYNVMYINVGLIKGCALFAYHDETRTVRFGGYDPADSYDRSLVPWAENAHKVGFEPAD